MHVFLTGATGQVGSAVMAELIHADHTVAALTRSAASARRARVVGAEAVDGALSDLDVLRAQADKADGVIHLAFGNDFSSPEALERNVAEESAALTAIGEALVQTDKPFVTVSGTPVARGRPSTEADPVPTEGPVGGRAASVIKVLDLASRGVRSSSVRLPRTVHADGQGGFAGMLTEFARQSRIAGYPGNGSQRWPAVHALDAAVLFRLALEKAPGGTIWHAVHDEGDRVRDIAEVIGRRLGIPVSSRPVEAFGVLGAMFAADQPSASKVTQEQSGWKPIQVPLLTDLEQVRSER